MVGLPAGKLESRRAAPWAAVVAVLVGLSAGPALGQLDAEASRRAHQLAADVMSPFCPGRTLADCPSPDAAALRQEVRGLLDAGTSESEVRELLARRFGADVTGVPRSAVGWAVPGIALALGAFGLAVALWRLRAGSDSAPPTAAPDPGLEAELEAEVRARTRS